MTNRVTQAPCQVCGAPVVWDGKHKKQRLRCFACGMEALFEVIDSMVAKKGPAYDRWLTGMAMAVERAQADRLDRLGSEPSVPNE